MVIIPFKSVGNLLFSDSRQEIRKKINEKFDAGVKEFGGFKDYYDYFKESDLMVGYDENNNVSAFEFCIYAQSPIFNGVDLLTERFIDLISMFSSLDPELENDVGEFTSYKYGIGAHIDYSKEKEIACAESIIVFRKGYYDALKNRKLI